MTVSLLNRQRGCLLGLAVGDALGVPAEFKMIGEFEPITNMRGGGPFRLNPGEWTDDTSMALCLGDELLEHPDGIDPITLHQRFWRWFQRGDNSHNGRCFDIGNTTRTGLYRNKDCKRTGTFDFPPGDNPWGASNGSIMRLAPVPVRWPQGRDKALQEAHLQGRITHGNREAVLCTESLCDVILSVFESGRLELVWMDLIEDTVSGDAYCWSTLSAAIWAVSQTDSFEAALLKAVNLGNDADTVGAVCGQIAGALYGVENIPPEWLEVLAWKEKIDDMAIKLAGLEYAGAPNA